MQNDRDKSTRKYVIALDVGSSATKVGLVDQDGNVVGRSNDRYDTYFLPDGGVEQDPMDWWRASSGAKVIRIRGESTGYWLLTQPANGSCCCSR
jgi:glycerol kinase